MNFYKEKTKQPIWLTFHGDLKKLIRFELMRPASLLENKKKRKRDRKEGSCVIWRVPLAMPSP